MKKIGILGLGWLGKALASELQKEGFEVKGSTTTLAKKLQLKQEGFQAFQLLVEADGIKGEADLLFKDLDLLIINIPPKISKDDEAAYIRKVQNIIAEIHNHQIERILYVSTTSVFEDAEDFPIYNEQSQPNASTPKALQLIEAEQLFFNQPNFTAAVVRFGGLVGNGRHPVLYFTGKKNLANPTAPVNLIHLQDCIRLIMVIIHRDTFNFVFHGVSTIEANKEDFYTASAKKRNLEVPTFSGAVSSGKKISAQFTSVKLNIQLAKDVL